MLKEDREIHCDRQIKHRATAMAMRCLTVLLFVVLVASAVSCSAMSIDAGPVKVTQRNSGPRYEVDIDKSEAQTRQNQQDQRQSPPAPALQQPDDNRPVEPSDGGREVRVSSEDMPIGPVSIRRIYLFPKMAIGLKRPGDWSQADSAGPRDMVPPPSGSREQENEHEQMPSMFAKPFWPFLTPARPSPNHQDHEHPRRPHLFGSDEASRSPTGERDQDQAASGAAAMGQPIFDPVQMMMDMMHQAINSQLVPSFITDLNNNNNNNNNKAPSSNNDNSPAETSDERPQVPDGELTKASGLRPGAHNETREDIVEIEGKKYLRKTVTNRHVGENIIFMTRRLIFVPLNETDSSTNTTDTVATTAKDSSPAPTTDWSADRASNSTPVSTGEQPVPPKSSTEEQTSQVSSSTTTTTTSTAPTTTTSETPSTESNVESVTLPMSSPAGRDSNVAGKAAERLIETTRSQSQTEPATSISNKNNETNATSAGHSSA